MGLFSKYFIDVKRGSKVTYSESDLRKLDRNYENEVFPKERKRVMSPLRKVPQQAYLTQVRDYAFERVLDSHMYTFSHLLVVPNPYDLVKQSALVLFNSSKKTKIRYRVLGDTPEADFVGETEYTNRHRVPILGLYLERSNKVELEMIDTEEVLIKRRTIRIFVSETPKKIVDVIGETANKEATHFPFILVNGVSFNPLVVDCNSAIRYSLQLRTNSIGMIPLENGHFLYEDRTANRMDKNGQIKPCRYHEMDYMGRVYRTFLLEAPIIGTVAQRDESLFLVTSSDEKHIADQIIELDMNSGKIIKTFDLAKLVGDTYRTRENWANITHLSCYDGCLLITVKRLHTVIKLDWDKNEVKWVLAPESVWKGTDLEQHTLHGDVLSEQICRRPDFANVVEADLENGVEKILLFQEQSMEDVPLEIKDNADSGVVFIEVHADRKEFQTLCIHDCVKNQRFGSAVYSNDKQRILTCAGYLKQGEIGKKSKFMEMDSTSGEIYREMYFKKLFNKVWLFEPDIKQFSTAVEVTQNVIFGSINAPDVFEGELPTEAKKPIDPVIFSGARLCEELFISYILPGRIEKIYFVGENHVYVQDYSNMKESKVKFPFAVSVKDFEIDEYFIYVQSRGVVHRLKNEIRIVDENEMNLDVL